MKVSTTSQSPQLSNCDTVVVGAFAGEQIDHDSDSGAIQRLLDSGEAKTEFKHMAVTHEGELRYLAVGLGKREDFDREQARTVSAAVVNRAKQLGSKALYWALPSDIDSRIAAGLVEGTELASYKFDRFKSKGDEESDQPAGLKRLVIGSPESDRLKQEVSRALTIAQAQNAARDLQNTPANLLTPQRLGEHARQLGEEIEGLQVRTEGRSEILDRGMGAFAAVAQGAENEPQLIEMRYEGPGASGPTLAFVGKAVTFDTGGISLKPPAKMHEMKYDMSGGAAVIEAVAAIARLKLPVRLIGVVGATENMPSGNAVRPGDIVTAMNGTTIEVWNTDAEGRMVLADCLSYAVELGAERIVDMATLTGAIIVALGSTFAGLMSNDDEWAKTTELAGERSGEQVWRLPLHKEFAKQIEGPHGDIVNAPMDGKAGSITAAEFLKRFVNDLPWAHIDIAGTAWNLGREYAGKHGSGFGVRLLVELAESVASS